MVEPVTTGSMVMTIGIAFMAALFAYDVAGLADGFG
jgi:hypothetical protein